MATVSDTGGSTKLRALMKRIREQAPEALKQLGANLAAEAGARAPSMEEESATMMYGEGNPAGITASPGGSSNSDGDGRLRFILDNSHYLANWIPTDYVVSGLTLGVGTVANLNVISTYQWRNIDQQIYTSLPFWEAWENGGQFHVVPRSTKSDGSRYPLAPSLDPKENRDLFEMDKTIPRKQMYGGIDIDAAVDQVLLPALDKIVDEA